MKILISDKTSPRCAEKLRAAGHEVDEKFDLSPDELKAQVGQYEGIIVRSATEVTAEIIENAHNLKVIGRAGSGVDNIDVTAASKKNIVVMNTPGSNTNAVAEMALAFALALSRQLFPAISSMKNKKWDKKKFMGSEIEEKTMGLLGYTRVARLFAEKCLALGMRVLCFDPKISKDLVDESDIELVSSEDMIYKMADFVSIHLNKKEETRHFINKEKFLKMKKGAYFLNLSRGGIVNEADLLWALNEEIVAGAALDVFEKEPPEEFGLIEHPRVICTPHIGASTDEAQENVAVMIADQFIDFFAGKGIRNAVNV